MKHDTEPMAFALIRGGERNPQIRGMVKFYESRDGVVVETKIQGLPGSGFFGFHIHEGGDCAGAGFPNTGSHYNPEGKKHPSHAGDLPPLLGNHGRAYMKVFTNRIRPEEIIGKTVIVHDKPDDFTTQPSGNAGAKIACGVIREI